MDKCHCNIFSVYFYYSHSYYIFNRNDLFITCGATYGLYLLATLFFHSGDMVFMEEASYHRVATILGDELKLQVIPGMCISILL